MLGLLTPTEGKVIFEGEDIFRLPPKTLRKKRENFQIIFQNPYASLNPRMKVSQIIAEPLIIHYDLEKKPILDRVIELMEAVGLKRQHLNRYPVQFSGGERQRIGIARALATNPKFIICDEPVSNLDLSIQAQVLNLLLDLQTRFKLTYLFIAHNLEVIASVSDRIMVMYLGKIVEVAPNPELYERPMHPYTDSLLKASRLSREDELEEFCAEAPSSIYLPSGCRFHPRCPYRDEVCKSSEPFLKEINPGHYLSCHHPLKSNSY